MTARKWVKGKAAGKAGRAGMIERRESVVFPIVGIAELRKRAEDVVREKESLSRDQLEALSLGNLMVLSPEEIRKTLHELRVHQCELEMQNEELRRAQAETSTAQARYFDFYDLAPVGYVTVSEKGMILEANLTTAKLLGVVRSTLVQQPITQFILPDDQDIYYLHRKRLVETGEAQGFEVQMVKSDGVTFWVRMETIVAQNTDGGSVSRIVLSDITERKRAADARCESEGRLREVLENSLDSSYKRNLQTNAYEYLSPVFRRISGYSPDEFKALPLEIVLSLMSPEDKTKIERVIVEALSGAPGESYQVEYHFKHKDGQYRWLHDQFTVLRDGSGKPLALVGSVSDITERKWVEELLKRSEQRYSALVELSLEAIVVHGNGEILYVNPSAIQMFGASSAQDLVGKSIVDMIHPDSRQGVLTRVKDAMDGGVSVGIANFKYLKLDGTIIDAEAQGTSMVYDGKPAMQVSMRDITERKRVEEALHESEQRFSVSFQTAPYAITITRPENGTIIDVNDAFISLSGYSRVDVVETSFTSMKLWVDEKNRDEVISTLQKGCEVVGEEFLFRKKNGEVFLGSFSAKIVHLNRRSCILSTIQDITDRKRIEKEILEAKDRLLLAARAGGVGIWDYDPVENVLLWDDQMFRLYGITRETFSGVYEAWRSGLHPEDLVRGDDDIQMALRGEKEFDTEFRIAWPDGTIHHIRALGLVHRDATGKPLHMIGTNWDITESKQGEESIKQLLREKELLLKEVHHRIKNNINTLMSLLSLQSDSFKNAEAVAALNDAKDRMRSMLVLYDKLHRSEDLRELSLNSFLTPLIDEIVDNFPNKRKVTIDTNIDEIRLDVKRLSPLGILINELLTNIMKHAFTGRDHGLITVDGTIIDTHVAITVQDDGVGIPASVDIGNSPGFGLQLVDMLTKQLNGTIRIERENGTKFILEFEA